MRAVQYADLRFISERLNFNSDLQMHAQTLKTSLLSKKVPILCQIMETVEIYRINAFNGENCSNYYQNKSRLFKGYK